MLRRLVAGDAGLGAMVRAKGGGDRGAPRREGGILRVVVGAGRRGPNGGRQKILAELDVLRTAQADRFYCRKPRGARYARNPSAGRVPNRTKEGAHKKICPTVPHAVPHGRATVCSSLE